MPYPLPSQGDGRGPDHHRQGHGRLAEIKFWRDRNAAISTLYEQITMEKVQRMRKVLQLIEAAALPSFEFHFSELTRMHVEAKDIVKFLATLERHFKNMTLMSKNAHFF